MYKVFFNKKVIYISPTADVHSRARLKIFPFQSSRTINEAFMALLNYRDISGIIIHHDNVEELWQNFKNHFTVIKAAGGLVVNPSNEYLFIYRYGKWDLPKGKIEEGEDEETASIREVQEECGLKKMKITEKLPPTCHIYELEGNFVLKLTYWFRMVTKDDTKLKPQREEGITKAKWLNNQQVFEEALKNTYPSVKELVSFSISPEKGGKLTSLIQK